MTLPRIEQSDDPASTERSIDDETRAVFSKLTETIVAMAPAGCSAAATLTECRESVESTSGLVDFRPLRDSISGCLAAIREESERARKRGSNGKGADALDPATGLPGPSNAQALVSTCLAERKPLSILVTVLGQLRALNARFGRTVGDEVLALVAEDFSHELGKFGTLFRWRGPAFVVISDRGASQARTLEQRIKSLAAKRLEKTVNIESRSIHLKITFSWKMLEVNLEDSVEDIARRIDDFVSPHVDGPSGARIRRDLTPSKVGESFST